MVWFDRALGRITYLQIFCDSIIAIATMQDKIALLVRRLWTYTQRNRFSPVDVPATVIVDTLEPIDLVFKGPQECIIPNPLKIDRVQKLVEMIRSAGPPEQLSLCHVAIINVMIRGLQQIAYFL